MSGKEQVGAAHLFQNRAVQGKALAPRVKPVRITLDLDSDLHTKLKVRVATMSQETGERITLADLARALFESALDDKELEGEIKALIVKQKRLR